MSKQDDQQLFTLTALISAMMTIAAIKRHINPGHEFLLHHIIFTAAKTLHPAAVRRIAFECARSSKSGRAAIEEALSMLGSERWETVIDWLEKAQTLDDDRLWLATSPVLFL